MIDLDNVWKWLGFSVKIKAKTLLEKHFICNKDYINLIDDITQQDLTGKNLARQEGQPSSNGEKSCFGQSQSEL